MLSASSSQTSLVFARVEIVKTRCRATAPRRPSSVSLVNPARGAYVGVKLPVVASGVQSLPQDIEPEQLLAQGMPKRSFAQLAYGFVVDHDAAASYAATISRARAATSATVKPDL